MNHDKKPIDKKAIDRKTIHSSNEKKETAGQLMEAIGEIDPKYIEEARQAASPEQGQKRSAVRILAAACLVLAIAYGIQKTGFLSGFTLFSEYEKSTGSGQASSGNSGSQLLKANENTANETKEENETLNEYPESAANENDTRTKQEADTILLAQPPILTLYSGAVTESSSGDTESANFIDIRSTEYSWSCKQEIQKQSSSLGSGTDLWTFASLPVLSASPGTELSLDFNEAEPDSCSIRYLSVSDAKKADRENFYQEIPLEKDGSFLLPEEENSYIIEIHAVWDNDIYEGDCIYGLKADVKK